MRAALRASSLSTDPTYYQRYDTGQISDILLMDDFLLRFATCTTPGDAATCQFKTAIEGLIVGLLSIGTLFGALLGAPLADRLGRRWAMTTECGIFTIGVLIQVTAFQAWYQVAIGRFIAGLGVGGLSAAVPLYQVSISEVFLPDTRADKTFVCQTGRDRTKSHSRYFDCNLPALHHRWYPCRLLHLHRNQGNRQLWKLEDCYCHRSGIQHLLGSSHSLHARISKMATTTRSKRGGSSLY